jgi:hypothetical protein
MTASLRSTRLLAIAALVTTVGAPLAGGAQQTSYESLNVCERVPPAEVAAAVSGRPVDQRPVNPKGLTAARCVYGTEVAGSRRAFVVWVNPVADYDGLRQASEPPITDVKGVGDDAFAIVDKETKRTQLTARKRGKVTVQVTAESMEWAQAVAKVALSKF